MTEGTMRGTPYRWQPDQRETWMDDALCAEVGGEEWFPEKGGSTREAKKLCASCDVEAQCLAFALDNDERFGIWGGKSERERRKMRKAGVTGEQIIAEMNAAREAARPAPRPTPPPFRPAGLVKPVRGAEADAPTVPVAEEQPTPKPAKWRVSRVWVAIAPDGMMHGPFVGQPEAYEHVKAALTPIPDSKVPAVARPEKRGYRRWTAEDDAAVRRMHAEGMTDSAIARALDRNQGFVSVKRGALDLVANGNPLKKTPAA